MDITRINTPQPGVTQATWQAETGRALRLLSGRLNQLRINPTVTSRGGNDRSPRPEKRRRGHRTAGTALNAASSAHRLVGVCTQPDNDWRLAHGFCCRWMANAVHWPRGLDDVGWTSLASALLLTSVKLRDQSWCATGGDAGCSARLTTNYWADPRDGRRHASGRHNARHCLLKVCQ